MPKKFPNCSAALEALAKGLDEETCHSFKGLRQVVMCDAWHGRTEPFTPETFHERIEESWAKVRQACQAHGGTTPEYGFLSPQRTYEPISEAIAAKITGVREIRKNGLHAGLVIEQDDGTVDFCLDSNCGTIKRGAGIMENLEAILETAGYEVVD